LGKGQASGLTTRTGFSGIHFNGRQDNTLSQGSWNTSRTSKRNHVSARKRINERPYAIRKPKDYVVGQPGDLVQLDTLDIRPLPGQALKQFTARDTVSRWDVLGVYSRATSTTATHFLDKLGRNMPFPVRAIQVDGGSEFEAIFEGECQKRGIKLFVLPPRSPKLNGCVERAHRTHTEEFYEVTDSSFELPDLRDKLSRWETVYNTVRPHQALDYLTPFKFLEQWYKAKERRSGVTNVLDEYRTEIVTITLCPSGWNGDSDTYH